MEKKFKVIAPSMPNFVRFEEKAGFRQEGFKPKEGFHIRDFTQEEAEEFAELMKQTFIEHWKAQQPKS